MLPEKKMYQIQVFNENIIIRNVALVKNNNLENLENECPDIIIKENFGKNCKLNLYSCVYSEKEINFIKSDNYFPIIKLVSNEKKYKIIFSIVVKFNEEKFIQNSNITNFDLYYVWNVKGEQLINSTKVEKNINFDNIIEILFENIIESGFALL